MVMMCVGVRESMCACEAKERKVGKMLPLGGGSERMKERQDGTGCSRRKESSLVMEKRASGTRDGFCSLSSQVRQQNEMHPYDDGVHTGDVETSSGAPACDFKKVVISMFLASPIYRLFTFPAPAIRSKASSLALTASPGREPGQGPYEALVPGGRLHGLPPPGPMWVGN